MKNKLLLGSLLIGIAGLFTACSDDKDSNPSLIQPTEFKLNNPTYINQTVNLKNTSELPLSWSQPKYTNNNAPLLVTYEIQVSPTNTYTISTDQADADETGMTIANYAAIARTTTMCTYSLLSTDLNTALLKLQKWTSETDVPEKQPVFLRVNAFILENGKRLNSVVSNAVELSFNPYYEALKDADPVLFYLTGNIIGDGKWTSKTGESCFPMFTQSGVTYDKVTGTGEITYMNYFSTGEFKIQPSNWDWSTGFWSFPQKANDITYRDKKDDGGANSNIYFDPAGYYRITIDTKALTCQIENLAITPTVYDQICITGTINDWKDTNMTPVNKEGENHVWCYSLTVDAGKTEQIKFKIPDSWDMDWGYGEYDGEVNTCGKAYKWGKNIGVEAGSWIIMFNDITGEFSILTKVDDLNK